MKKLLLFFIMCSWVLIGVAQQKNSVPVKWIRLDTAATIGNQDGEAETKEIGKEGGNIVSADGKLELIFPKLH
ncbi:MAG: hypothetical protein ACXWC7_14640 [Chitinophagaceae bacterium]